MFHLIRKIITFALIVVALGVGIFLGAWLKTRGIL